MFQLWSQRSFLMFHLGTRDVAFSCFLRLRHVYLFGKPTSARREPAPRDVEEASEPSEPPEDSDDDDDETRAPSPEPNDAGNDATGHDGGDGAAPPSSPTTASPQSPAASSLPAAASPGMAKDVYSLYQSMSL